MRLIIIALLLTYFTGTIFYFISSEFNNEQDMAEGNYFNKQFKMDQYASNPIRLQVILYFSLTIISTVGYGDKVPISNIE